MVVAKREGIFIRDNAENDALETAVLQVNSSIKRTIFSEPNTTIVLQTFSLTADIFIDRTVSFESLVYTQARFHCNPPRSSFVYTGFRLGSAAPN